MDGPGLKYSLWAELELTGQKIILVRRPLRRSVSRISGAFLKLNQKNARFLVLARSQKMGYPIVYQGLTHDVLVPLFRGVETLSF